MSDHSEEYSEFDELEPTLTNGDGTITHAGDEVFVRGIGENIILGIGVFAGSLVLQDSNGEKVQNPLLVVQDEFVSGGQVDLWTTDPGLIAEYRDQPVYPITLYLIERATARARIVEVMDRAHAAAMGIDPV